MSDLVSQNLNMIFKSPKGETVHALKDLNFTIKKGELLTVLGPSGCGKTTLLNIAAGFIRPTSGTITLGNNEINGPGVDRGMVFQQGALFEWLTVSENVNFGLRMKKKDPEETQKKVISALRANPNLSRIESDYSRNRPEIKLLINKNKAKDLGISIKTIGETLETLYGGKVVTKFNKLGKEYPIILQQYKDDRK